MTLSDAHILYTPRLAVECLHSFVVVSDAPVGTSNTLKLILVAQLILDHPLAEATTYVLARRILVEKNTVDRHYSRSHASTIFQLESTLSKRDGMLFTVVAWINGKLTIVIVRVTTTFLSTIAIPVLHHSVYALVAPGTVYCLIGRRGLETVTVCTSQVSSQFCSFTKCTVETAPARISCKVYLRRQCSSDTQCTVFLRSNLTEFLHQGRVEGSSHTQR